MNEDISRVKLHYFEGFRAIREGDHIDRYTTHECRSVVEYDPHWILEVESDEFPVEKLLPENCEDEDTSQWKPERLPDALSSWMVVGEGGGFGSNNDFLWSNGR